MQPLVWEPRPHPAELTPHVLGGLLPQRRRQNRLDTGREISDRPELGLVSCSI